MGDRNLAGAAPSTVASNYPNSGLESEMKAELKRQGLEIENLKRMFANFHHQGHGKESAANQAVTVTSIPRFISNGDRYIEGIERFIEGIEPKTNLYDSYAQWYDDVFERMGYQYSHQKYYLAKGSRCQDDNKVISFESYTGRIGVKRSDFMLETESLKEGYTHRNTKLVCVLHPKNPQACLELDQSKMGEKSMLTEEKEFAGFSYSWCSKYGVRANDIEQYCRIKTGCYGISVKCMILCAIKY